MFSKKYFEQFTSANALWRCAGDFGEVSGEIQRDGNKLFCESNGCRLECTYERDAYGVVTRRDTVKNISNKSIHLRAFNARFVFEGGEYEVYTQYNNWQSESLGGWQSLVTNVTATGQTSRPTQDATPFMVLWSKQENRGVPFHLLPNFAWEIKATKAGLPGKYSKAVVDIGICDYNLNMELNPNEEFSLGTILCYETQNKLDLDCYKLHNYMHTNYPRKIMPMIYNSWLYRFDHFTPDGLMKQADYAAKLGLEYFLVDAGWFGKGEDWWVSVGDWVENKTGGLCGRMKELSDKVHSLGMKFGIWVEPQRANKNSDAIRNHSEYYQLQRSHAGNVWFFNFAMKEAREWMIDVIDDLIATYNIDYFKFDNNASDLLDKSSLSFAEYQNGFDMFVRTLREHNPHLYLTNCASGGMQMELDTYTRFDSVWPSDNESPYEEMRMYKETILRFPPQGFERWNSVHSLLGFEDFYSPFVESNGNQRMVACADAVWYDVVGVHPSYLDAYQTCGPIGFSCDLSKIAPDAFAHFQEKIAKTKANRAFWQTAVARILADTPTLTVYQYSDMSLNEVVLQAISGQILSDRVTVYPVLDANKTYLVNGETKMSGCELMEDGLNIAIRDWKEITEVTFQAI